MMRLRDLKPGTKFKSWHPRDVALGRHFELVEFGVLGQASCNLIDSQGQRVGYATMSADRIVYVIDTEGD